MNEKINTEFEEDEIDLGALFLKLISRWYVLIAGLLAGAVIGFLCVTLLISPIYSSTAKVYLRGNGAKLSLESLNLSSQLTSDYEIIFTSRPNLQAVIDALNLDMTVEDLTEIITITNPQDTRILEITVTDNDPVMAKNIANEVLNQGVESVREIDSQEPYVIERGIENDIKINASVKKYVAVGALLGLMTAVGIISLLFILNDHIQSREDVENYLNIPVLTTVLEDVRLDSSIKKRKKL